MVSNALYLQVAPIQADSIGWDIPLLMGSNPLFKATFKLAVHNIGWELGNDDTENTEAQIWSFQNLRKKAPPQPAIVPQKIGPKMGKSNSEGAIAFPAAMVNLQTTKARRVS